jgi:N4-gp56 family major capsid protein
MGATNFSLLTNEQKTAWSMEFWRQARNLSFVNKFLGKGPNSLIQHITELKKTEKGARAVITLLADLEGDGIAGDRTLEGNEEQMKSYDQVIRIDQMRNANRHEGRMADQKSVVNFRENSRDKLAYWLADRIDQLAFLTLAGKAYTFHPNGVTRVGSDLKNLEFSADVTAPSAKRVARWNGTTKLLEIGTGQSSVATADTPMWDMFVQLKAYAKENYVRGVMDGGEETYHAFLSPNAMAKLKMDAIYRDNLRYAQQRGGDNALFTGTAVKLDGIYLHEFRHVPNTRLAPNGSKYGGGSIDGCQVLFCGAQALGMADIGNPEWVEKEFDYDNQPGISVAKILGFKKPVFTTQYSGGTQEDHGVISTYVAQ